MNHEQTSRWPHWLNWLPFGRVPALSASQLANHLDAYYVLDVRTPLEWRRSRIPGAHSLPLHRLSDNVIQQLPADQPIICVCLTAHRSKPATRKLRQAGLQAMELEGGMRAWWKQHLPNEHSPPG